ncbi:MAG: hypothetical protein RML36_06890 [Anaerolineae bacterium]|nr:hypothetical protein [Anaerolineae bacterium]MDW8099194.1 hypothetical protein [Anaerolineae bacterium]
MGVKAMISRNTVVHPWLRTVKVAFIPGPMDSALQQTTEGVLNYLRNAGHSVVNIPDNETDAIITTAYFGHLIDWRTSLMVTARRKYGLRHNPTVFTYVSIPEDEFQRHLKRFDQFVRDPAPNPRDYQFPGLAPEAYQVLYEQGKRGGPILALERLIQAQTKSLRVVLIVVGRRGIKEAYHFDLAGAYPRTKANDLDYFYEDIALRMVTALSTKEVTNHEVVDDPIPRSVWDSLTTPSAMIRAAQELNRRNFFTEMVVIPKLVHMPAVGDAVARQYSEGCFATYDPVLRGLVSTVTGSARPVDKGNISEDDLAVIIGVKPTGDGALVRHVQGKRNDPPSSEAVEMMDMDRALPSLILDSSWGINEPVPMARSKLHGHRGVASYHPAYVEFAPLDAPYYDYLVSCATQAQAWGIKQAFSRSEALRNPSDPRQVVFTVLPGHGVVIVEKWVRGKAPFEVILNYMDAGHLEIVSPIPQGRFTYVPSPSGRMVLQLQDE